MFYQTEDSIVEEYAQQHDGRRRCETDVDRELLRLMHMDQRIRGKMHNIVERRYQTGLIDERETLSNANTMRSGGIACMAMANYELALTALKLDFVLMTEDLLRDLALYKKSHEKAVSAAARSLIAIFRQICPSLLDKKDRGRVVDRTVRPRAFGEKVVGSDVPGADLLLEDHASSSDGGSEDEDDVDEDIVQPSSIGSDKDVSDDVSEEGTDDESEDSSRNSVMNSDTDDEEAACEEDEHTDLDEEIGDLEEELSIGEKSVSDQENGSDKEGEASHLQSEIKKRKLIEPNTDKDISGQSLRALKKFAAEKDVNSSLVNSGGQDDGIFSNEDFERIRELQTWSASIEWRIK
ncbi:hypothetical protein KI387_023580, partial [Taxus chinensis]